MARVLSVDMATADVADRIRPYAPLALLIILVFGVNIAEPGFASFSTLSVGFKSMSIQYTLPVRLRSATPGVNPNACA